MQSTNLQLAGTGVDVKAVQGYVRDLLGITSLKIGGEITARKDDSGVEYHVKIRKTPEHTMLVDFKTKGSIEDVISKIALKILETTDPHIAAATYWSMGDEANSLRLIDVVLSNENIYDDKYALNLRAYINITNKRYEEAQKDIDAIQKLAPDFPALLSSKAWLAREKGDFLESLKISELQIAKAPDKWWGHQARAQSLQGLKREQEAANEYLKVIAMRPEIPAPYLNAGRYFLSKSDLDNASLILSSGVSKFKENPSLNLIYADILTKKHLYVFAESIYKKFLNDKNFKIHSLIGICELSQLQNKRDELKRNRDVLKSYLRENPMNPIELKSFEARIEKIKI